MLIVQLLEHHWPNVAHIQSNLASTGAEGKLHSMEGRVITFHEFQDSSKWLHQGFILVPSAECLWAWNPVL